MACPGIEEGGSPHMKVDRGNARRQNRGEVPVAIRTPGNQRNCQRVIDIIHHQKCGETVIRDIQAKQDRIHDQSGQRHPECDALRAIGNPTRSIIFGKNIRHEFNLD